MKARRPMNDPEKEAETTAPVTKARRRSPSGSRKKVVKTARTIVALPERVRLAAEAAAKKRGLKLSPLIAGGVARCVLDDIWSPRVRMTVSSNKDITPPPELVDIANGLLAMGMLLEEVTRSCDSPATLDEASRIWQDCKTKLERLRDQFGC